MDTPKYLYPCPALPELPCLRVGVVETHRYDTTYHVYDAAAVL